MPTHLISKTIFFILALLIGIQVLVANQLATAGINLSKLQQQMASLHQENHQLSQQLQFKTSLHYLTEQANLQGYLPTSKILSVRGPEPLAMKP